MTTLEMNKYAYELMVKNNPDEAVKQLLLKDKLTFTNDRLIKIIRSLSEDLAAANKRIKELKKENEELKGE